MAKRWLFLVWVTVLPLARAQADKAPVAKPVRPIPAIEHVVVIGVDGARPDVLLLADTPTLHGLIKQGAYTMWARTTAVSVTIPSFMSMMTGVTPRKHLVEWDRDLPFAQPVYPRYPTVMEMATQAGYVTAMVAGKGKFSVFNKPGTITHAFVPTVEKAPDADTAVQAVKVITDFKPDFLFVHFAQVDSVGHAKGWGSHEQLEQLAATDGDIAQVLAALDRAGMRDATAVIVSADHGGAGLTHGPDDPRSRHIPWIVSGPGVKSGCDLTQDAVLTVRTEDTCATACWLLGLPLPEYFDGRPVKEAFETAK
ncbi:MAG TPA: alkaline phosphatase family protein [Opitutus sp.]|nr:alkaline phosphatase family protein [Opitutus sp.]